MQTTGRAGRVLLAGGFAAALLLCAVALTTVPAMAGTGTATDEQSLFAGALPKAPDDAAGTEWWWRRRYVALYKTISYTAVVLTTDQLWYMGLAAQAAGTSGLYGVVNLVTSPILTYGFEYGWERCCEAAPGPDGVRPVDVNKALIYRALSATRTLGLALLFGNSLGSSLLVTGAITVTRTLAYIANDYVWNRITKQAPAVKWPTFLGPEGEGG
jgi:uncharacterized membrane protein